ncbi:Uncharacterised protein [Bacillus freudenreichii]|nr:Uncharacterised protein [Bacillus freudenreichii]
MHYGYGGMMAGFGFLGYLFHLLLTGIVVYVAVKLAMKK